MLIINIQTLGSKYSKQKFTTAIEMNTIISIWKDIKFHDKTLMIFFTFAFSITKVYVQFLYPNKNICLEKKKDPTNFLINETRFE